MPKYTDILELEAARDNLTARLGHALLSLDTTRDVLLPYKAQPAVGTPFVVLEDMRFTPLDNTFAADEFALVTTPVTLQRDTIKEYEQVVEITAASGDPQLYLMGLDAKFQDATWRDLYFGEENISIISVSPVVPRNLPVEGGDWEMRSVVTVTARYFAKTTVILDTISNITGTISILE